MKSRKSPVMRGVLGAMTIEVANNKLIQLLGEKALDMAQAVYVRNRVLTIACLSPIMAQEIKLNEQKLIRDINEKIGGQEVEKIRYLA